MSKNYVSFCVCVCVGGGGWRDGLLNSFSSHLVYQLIINSCDLSFSRCFLNKNCSIMGYKTELI